MRKSFRLIPHFAPDQPIALFPVIRYCHPFTNCRNKLGHLSGQICEMAAVDDPLPSRVKIHQSRFSAGACTTFVGQLGDIFRLYPSAPTLAPLAVADDVRRRRSEMPCLAQCDSSDAVLVVFIVIDESSFNLRRLSPSHVTQKSATKLLA